MRAFNSVLKCIAENATTPGHKIIVEKSTVPVGTAQAAKDFFKQNRSIETFFTLASMPEFLAEGTAIRDLT